MVNDMNYPFTTEVDLPNWGECEVQYDVEPADLSVGFQEAYEWKIIYGGAFEDVGFDEGTDITMMMSQDEEMLIEKAIKKDLRDM
jgi:hypothetical protein